MNAPDVSVIIPTQGIRASLGAALRSALAQDFSSFEVLVVDDAVGETHWREQPEIAPLLRDRRVRVVDFHQSRGCAAAKNAGVRAALGRWVCYLDDDNEYHPEKIRAQQALAARTRSPLVLCGLEIRVKNRRRRRQVTATEFAGDDLLLATSPDTNVIFHERDSGIGWDESLETGDDVCFFQAFVQRHQLRRVPNVPRALVVYMAHGGSRANRARTRVYRGQRCLITRWTRPYSRPARRIVLLRALLAAAKFETARWSRFVRLSGALLRVGGWRELRGVLNATGMKIPFIRSWMVS